MQKVGYDAVNIEKAAGTLKNGNISAGIYLEARNQLNYTRFLFMACFLISTDIYAFPIAIYFLSIV